MKESHEEQSLINPKQGVTQDCQEHTHRNDNTGQRNQGTDNTLNTELNVGN